MSELGPQWRAMQREAQLAAEQIAQGVTALGRANHAQTGLYTQAFFGLSIGMERLGKLIFVADHAIQNGGTFPTNDGLKKICHNLGVLFSTCETIAHRVDAGRSFAPRPAEPVHRGIEEVLSEFATRSRYYNLNYLAGAAGSQQDPIALWWERVATPILAGHYSKNQRKQDESDGAFVKQVFGDSAMVLHSTESGEPLRDLSAMYTQGRATAVVQKYGRLHTLQIVRWLASILYELAHHGAYEKRIEALLGLNEPFILFYNEDELLRRRKRWSIYRL